jgi:hypothetical protein
MPTLSQISSESKSLVKWGGIVLGAIILIFILFNVGKMIKTALFPTPAPPPTVGYGKLPQPDFPKKEELRNFTYSIDTVSGNLPSFPDRLNVYKMIKPQADLLALKKTQEKLNNVDFDSAPVLVSQNIYNWTTTSPFSKTLSYNIFTSDFTLTSSYLTDSSINAGKNFPTDNTTISESARNFLSSIGSLPKDLDLERIKIDLLTIKNNVLMSATSISSAQAARVYFFQNNINKLPIFYSNPNTSPISLLITGGENEAQVVEASYNYQNASEEFETYPIKTAAEAFDMLGNGKGYIASSPENIDKISITNIYLAYYISENKQNYLMPIIVFEGNDNFFAYISAVKDEWISM